MNQTAEELLPWYRQVWFWMVVGPLLFIIVMCFITVSMAFHYSDDVVTDNYYKEGKAINQTLHQDERALALGLTADVRFDRTTYEVLVVINTAKPLPHSLPKQLLLFMDHPVKKLKDQHLVLREVIQGQYRGELNALPEFSWYLALIPDRDEAEGDPLGKAESESTVDALDLIQRKQADWLLTGNIDFSKKDEALLQSRVK